MINTKEFYNLLYYGKFEEAHELAKDLTLDELYQVMVAINEKEPTLTTYGYVISLLLENETAELHYLASCILTELLNSIEGAYVSGYWHAKRAVELEPDNIEYKEYLLEFCDLPGNLLEKKEAVALAKNILEDEPENQKAKNVLK